jgi:hypothetical protein
MDIKEIKLNFTLSNQIKQKSVYPYLAYCSVRNKVIFIFFLIGQDKVKVDYRI